MESQITPHPQYEPRTNINRLHSGEGEEDDGQHGKKSVLKKVKAKAKKIKDTLTKHGHAHDHDHDHGGHNQDLDEEDDDNEDDELVEDAELYGAPMYGAVGVRSPVAGQVQNPATSNEYKGETTTMNQVHDTGVAPKTTQFLSPGGVPVEKPHGQTDVNLGGTMDLEEDPHAPKDGTRADSRPNYVIKVSDPSGRGNEEVRPSGLVDSFAKMKVNNGEETAQMPHDESDELQTKNSGLSTGSHNQFSPEPNPSKLEAAVSETQPRDQSSYMSAVADKAMSAKDYMAEKLSPVYEKVAETGSSVISKMQKTGTEMQSETAAKGEDKGIWLKEYLAEKMTPSEEDRALSEVISGALHKRKETKGKVTESEEVRRRLGDENEGGEKPRDVSAAETGKRVMDKLKESVGAWWGKAGESVGAGEATQQHAGGTEAEVRVLQESTN